MSVYTRADSSKSMLCACGGDWTRLPVGAIGLPKLSGPVCVPLAREKNHTRLGSNGSTWNQLGSGLGLGQGLGLGLGLRIRLGLGFQRVDLEPAVVRQVREGLLHLETAEGVEELALP